MNEEKESEEQKVFRRRNGYLFMLKRVLRAFSTY